MSSSDRKTYVLDTSVLLADPYAIFRFEEHEVIIPIAVIGELETKRDHPELGYFARSALRALDDLRVSHGRLDKPLQITAAGGSLVVELNHTDTTSLPHSFIRDGSNDSRILAVARNLVNEGKDVVLVTKDLPLRVKASSVGIVAEEYRSAEQRVALDLLLDNEVGIVSLGGRAGTGKSALALCAGLEAVMERRLHKKVVVFRPLYPVGGQELGYLPGTEGEKMSPWAQAVFDTLGAVVSNEVIEEIMDRGLIEVLPLTHIRGRSLHDAFVIVDEAQSLERGVLLTVLSRIGQGSRVVLTHDVAQRDNLRVGRHDGIVAVIEALKGHPLFAHITLTRSERSQIAALVTEMLEDPVQLFA
ncbi:MAG: PhoH family protein [Actinobacteria bacterium]|nr:PhoH family protein [Actinomycetota bacterium]